jgi:hypothetical protein
MIPKEFADIIYLIKQARNKALMAVNTELINLYWNIGEYISRQISNSTWGDGTIDELSEFIQKENPDLKGFNRRGLYRMRRFYETYAKSKFVSSLMTQIKLPEHQSIGIVTSAMSQLETSDIRDTILAKITWDDYLNQRSCHNFFYYVKN